MTRIPYDNGKAITYAKKYCGAQDNSCGVFLNEKGRTDCAHFIAHCLAAGGLLVNNDDLGTEFCKHGLAVRNTTLVAQLDAWSAKYENIRKISLSDAIVGDVGFLRIERPRHAFMVCEVWNQFSSPFGAPKVWAHSTARCCEEMDTDFLQWFRNI